MLHLVVWALTISDGALQLVPHTSGHVTAAIDVFRPNCPNIDADWTVYQGKRA
jgi:hypothetical protein